MVRIKDLIRFKVYEPNGEFRGVLADPQDWQGSFPLSDVSALSLNVDLLNGDSKLLEGACEIAVEVQKDSGTWIEPRNARYLRIESSQDAALQKASMVRVNAVGYASLLDGAVVVPKKFSKAEFYDEDGKRKFLSATSGQVLATVLSEARGLVDGLIPGLELGFTPTRDSNGVSWKQVHTLYFEPGISFLRILQNLSEQGFVDWWFEGRRLMVVNAESRTKPGKQTLIPLGASEAPVRSTIGGLIHTALLVGDEGNVWRVDNSEGTPAPWGKTMKVLTQGGVKEERTAREMIQAELDAGSRERFEYTWQKPVAGLDWTPLVDVQPGDWVNYRTAHGVEPVRVFQVTLSGTGKNVKVALTLNDRFEDAQVRQAKRIKGIVNGAHGDAGTGSAPTKADKAEPAAPVGLVAESEGYWEDDEARSLVRVGFAPVTLDVHGLAIRIAYYEVNVGGKIVNSKTHTNIVVDGFVPNKGVAISVVAVSSEGVRSKPLVGRITTVQPDEKLAPSTKLAGGADYGIVNLAWDGKLQYQGGQPYTPPAHFDHIEIEESTDQRHWKVVGTARAGGITLDRQSVVGQTRYYRAWSVDRLRRRSDDPSPVTTVRVESKMRDELSQAQESFAESIKEMQEKEQEIRREVESRAEDFAGKVAEAEKLARQAQESAKRAAEAAVASSDQEARNAAADAQAAADAAKRTAEGARSLAEAAQGKADRAQAAALAEQTRAQTELAKAKEQFARDLASARREASQATLEALEKAKAAQAKALEAQAAADSIAGKITTGDGRFTVSGRAPYSSDAAGKPDNAVWEVKSGSQIISRYLLEAGSWRKIALGTDLIGEKAIGRAQIGDLAVGSAQIADLAVTDAKIGSLNVSKLSADRGKFSSAVIDSLVSDSQFVGSMTAKKILVGTPENPVKSVGIADGAVTADKVQASSALVQKLVTESLMAGKITSRMFSTDAGFKGPNLDINRYRIRATDSSNRETFSIGTNGEATFSGNITSRATITGATIVGATIKTRKSGTRLEMAGDNLISYDYSNRKTMQMTPKGMEFWAGDRLIGSMGENPKKGHPYIRGINMNLEPQGNFISWGYRKSQYDDAFTSYATFDPQGYFTSGKNGIHFDTPVFANSGLSPYENPQAVFKIETRNLGGLGSRMVLAYYYQGKFQSGLGFDGSRLLAIERNTWKPL